MDRQVVPLEVDGKAVLLEVRTDTEDGEQDVSALDDLSFDSVVESIEAITQKLASALTAVKPDSATLEFGIDVGLETGKLAALLVKGSGSAAIKITLVWESGTPAPADA